MNKTELIQQVADKVGITRREAEQCINATFDAITASLANDEKVQLVGFGAFEVKSRAARIGRNPKTKESIEIPAARVPAFKPGKVLKDAVCQ